MNFTRNRDHAVAHSGALLLLHSFFELSEGHIRLIFNGLIANSADQLADTFDASIECSLELMVEYHQAGDLEDRKGMRAILVTIDERHLLWRARGSGLSL